MASKTLLSCMPMAGVVKFGGKQTNKQKQNTNIQKYLSDLHERSSTIAWPVCTVSSTTCPTHSFSPSSSVFVSRLKTPTYRESQTCLLNLAMSMSLRLLISHPTANRVRCQDPNSIQALKMTYICHSRKHRIFFTDSRKNI